MLPAAFLRLAAVVDDDDDGSPGQAFANSCAYAATFTCYNYYGDSIECLSVGGTDGVNSDEKCTAAEAIGVCDYSQSGFTRELVSYRGDTDSETFLY